MIMAGFIEKGWFVKDNKWLSCKAEGKRKGNRKIKQQNKIFQIPDIESQNLLHEVIGSGPLFQARLTEVEMRITNIHMYTYAPHGGEGWAETICSERY